MTATRLEAKNIEIQLVTDPNALTHMPCLTINLLNGAMTIEPHTVPVDEIIQIEIINEQTLTTANQLLDQAKPFAQELLDNSDLETNAHSEYLQYGAIDDHLDHLTILCDGFNVDYKERTMIELTQVAGAIAYCTGKRNELIREISAWGGPHTTRAIGALAGLSGARIHQIINGK